MIISNEELRRRVLALSREEIDELVAKEKARVRQEDTAIGALALMAAPFALLLAASN